MQYVIILILIRTCMQRQKTELTMESLDETSSVRQKMSYKTTEKLELKMESLIKKSSVQQRLARTNTLLMVLQGSVNFMRAIHAGTTYFCRGMHNCNSLGSDAHEFEGHHDRALPRSSHWRREVRFEQFNDGFSDIAESTSDPGKPGKSTECKNELEKQWRLFAVVSGSEKTVFTQVTRIHACTRV